MYMSPAFNPLHFFWETMITSDLKYVTRILALKLIGNPDISTYNLSLNILLTYSFVLFSISFFHLMIASVHT